MPANTVTGSDTAQIDDRTLKTLADGNPFELTFENDFGAVKVGKNGNAIFAKNEMGNVVNASVRVLLGGSDDKYLNSRMAQWTLDPSAFRLLTGVFVKQVGDGYGSIASKVYECTGGFFVKKVDMKTSAEGDTDQSVAVYQLRFSNCTITNQ